VCVCVCGVPHLYSQFHPNPFSFGKVITEKPFHDPQSENNIGFFEPIITTDEGSLLSPISRKHLFCSTVCNMEVGSAFGCINNNIYS